MHWEGLSRCVYVAGLLVMAKNDFSHAQLCQQFQARTVSAKLICIICTDECHICIPTKFSARLLFKTYVIILADLLWDQQWLPRILRCYGQRDS